MLILNERKYRFYHAQKNKKKIIVKVKSIFQFVVRYIQIIICIENWCKSLKKKNFRRCLKN